MSILDSTSKIFTATNAEKQILICYSCIHAAGRNAYTWIGALPYSYASDACGWARDLNGLRGMRVRKSPLVPLRVLYAEATRPFPVNAKGVGPQTIQAAARDSIDSDNFAGRVLNYYVTLLSLVVVNVIMMRSARRSLHLAKSRLNAPSSYGLLVILN